MGFHVGAEDGVDAGLVAFAVLFEPLHDVVVDADGQAVFWFRQGELGCGPRTIKKCLQPKSTGAKAVFLIVCALCGAEAPLFHGCACGAIFGGIEIPCG